MLSRQIVWAGTSRDKLLRYLGTAGLFVPGQDVWRWDYYKVTEWNNNGVLGKALDLREMMREATSG